jgi:hypothetical protein
MHAAKPTGQIVEALRTSIKQGWERLTEGIVAFLAARGVTPNQVSFRRAVRDDRVGAPVRRGLVVARGVDFRRR